MNEHDENNPEAADFKAQELTVEDITQDGDDEKPESAGIPGRDQDADDELSKVREQRRADEIASQEARVKELREKAGLPEKEDRKAA